MFIILTLERAVLGANNYLVPSVNIKSLIATKW